MTTPHDATPSPVAATDLLDLAHRALADGDAEGALALCRELLDVAPGHRAARRLEAEALRDLRDALAAEDVYRDLVREDPADADAWAGMARALLDQGDDDSEVEASRCVSRAIRLQPHHAEALHTRALLRERRGDTLGAARDDARAWQASSRFPLPAALDAAGVRALLRDAALSADDPTLVAWVGAVPLVLDEVPSHEACAAYEPPASPADLIGHLAAPLGDDLPAGAHAGYLPALVIFRANLARLAADRAHAIAALRGTVLPQLASWIAQSGAQA